MTFIKRLNLVCGISLLVWKLPRDLSKPAASFKILILTHFILLDYLKLDAAHSLARCYVFFAWGTHEKHLMHILSFKFDIQWTVYRNIFL